VMLMHLSFIIMIVAFSLQVLQTDTESCWVRAQYSNFRSDIGAETFDDAYTNESQTMALTAWRRIKKEQSNFTLVWFSLLLIVNFFFESENLTLYTAMKSVYKMVVAYFRGVLYTVTNIYQFCGFLYFCILLRFIFQHFGRRFSLV